VRIVPRPQQTATIPERDHLLLVLLVEFPDLDRSSAGRGRIACVLAHPMSSSGSNSLRRDLPHEIDPIPDGFATCGVVEDAPRGHTGVSIRAKTSRKLVEVLVRVSRVVDLRRPMQSEIDFVGRPRG